MKKALLVLGVLFAGFVGGYWVEKEMSGTEFAAQKQQLLGERYGLVQLEQENQRLLRENASLKKTDAPRVLGASSTLTSNSSDLTNNQMGRLRMLAELQAQKLISVGLTCVGRDGKIADSFAKLFGLSESERYNLQQAVDGARRQIDEQILANITSSQDGDTLVLSVKPFDGASVMYDGLMDTFLHNLGPERNAAFITLISRGLGGYFDNYGAEERTIIFWRAVNEFGQPAVYSTDMKKSPTGGNASVSGPRDMNNLPLQYRWMSVYASKIAELPVRPLSNSSGK